MKVFKNFLLVVILLVLQGQVVRQCWAGDHSPSSFFDLTATTALGEELNFSDFRGKVVLVTNIATRCATTAQLADLERLYSKFKDRGFVVLGFPSEDFSVDQFDSHEEIHKFCAKKFGVTFPIFVNAQVTGDSAHSVFHFLTKKCPSELQSDVEFNFEKFLIGRDGQVKNRYGAFTGAMSSRLLADVEAELAKGLKE